ncbi:hypothetical protein CGMCC3_g14078 [Colletotrichum fructicola]|nr:uncharacterized protein CGMCC3_g14078 [Colletotrichum fructicola]KAE9569778.1 hypothetical protein CGMCC3_g14078 [Colletotrichum fructicola]
MLRRLGDVRQDLDPMQMQQKGGTATGGVDGQGASMASGRIYQRNTPPVE